MEIIFFIKAEFLGTIFGTDFTRLTISSPQLEEIFQMDDLRNIHFEIICRFLNCGLGIFNNGDLIKFGKWEYGSVIFLLDLDYGCYKPVLALQ